jgi:GxxExxY protein
MFKRELEKPRKAQRTQNSRKYVNSDSIANLSLKAFLFQFYFFSSTGQGQALRVLPPVEALTGLRGKDRECANSLLRRFQMSQLIHPFLSNKVMGAAIAVHKALGAGLLESAYEGAFEVELKYRQIPVARQVVFPLVYCNQYVGAYIAEMVVDNTIIIELKSVSKLNEVTSAQLINYLKLSGFPVGYLYNFGFGMAAFRPYNSGSLAAVLNKKPLSVFAPR